MDFEKTALGIELGSTRIKAVLTDEHGGVLAQGGYGWENKYENGYWTYSLDDVASGIKECYASLKADVKEKYGVVLKKVGVMGISAMMHGYLVFDSNDRLLVPFRTWRNNTADAAAKKLTELFNYRIPARWSIAHLYQAIIDGEAHVKDIAFMTALEGYVHYMLTGEKCIGLGEASGMFPVDAKTKDYDKNCIRIFNGLLKENGLPFTLEKIMPRALAAGCNAGALTTAGAKWLDPDGDLEAGIPLCPPEGDASTGMVATNCIKTGTGNISAGTSVFAMMVMDKFLDKIYPEIDILTTPAGDPVAMVHCNNCTSELNAWVDLIYDVLQLAGKEMSKEDLFGLLFFESLKGSADCDGITVYNYLSGEHITGVENGKPMNVRNTNSKLSPANFFRAQLYSCFATLKTGLNILFDNGIKTDKIYAHGGIFKTPGVAQKYLAAAANAPVSLMGTAGEGGAWGMALLALFLNSGKSVLSDFLQDTVFADAKEITELPNADIVKGFNEYMNNFSKGLEVERLASDIL